MGRSRKRRTKAEPINTSLYEFEADVAVWKAVICQVLRDIASDNKKSEFLQARQQAEEWLGTMDFDEVCVMAGFDPAYVQRRIKEARGRNFQWRLPAGQGWRTKLAGKNLE